MKKFKKNYHGPFLILAVCVISACGNKKSNDYEESRSIYQQAIEIHDEIMPRMGELMKLQKSLKEEKAQLTDESLIQKVDSTVMELEIAHDAMMRWMRNITRIPEDAGDLNRVESNGTRIPDPEEMKKIQENSLEEIKSVKKSMTESINNAESLLERLQIKEPN